MRLPARRIATSALCATVLLGITGPVATAAEGDSVRERTHAATRAPLPDADTLNKQVQALSGLGGLVTPVTDLLGAVLKADNGRLTTEQATRLGGAVDEALTGAEGTGTPAAQGDTVPDAATPGMAVPGMATPGTVAPGVDTPARLPALAQPPLVAQPGGNTQVTTLPAPFAPAADQAGTVPPGLVREAIDGLRESVDALLQASTTATPDEVSPAATGVVTDVVNVVAATLFSGGLPAPDLAGLPLLPAAPANPS